jgi:hypothetical protein
MRELKVHKQNYPMGIACGGRGLHATVYWRDVTCLRCLAKMPAGLLVTPAQHFLLAQVGEAQREGALRKQGELAALAGTKRGESMSIQQAVDFNRRLNPNHLRKTDVRIALGVLAGAVERYRRLNKVLERKLEERDGPDYSNSSSGVDRSFCRISSGVHPRPNHHWDRKIPQCITHEHPGVHVPDCSSAGAVPQHCSTIYCPWTGVTVPIWREAMIPDTVVHIADKLKISKRISPSNWVHWLCEQVLLVNPHLRSQVERYTSRKEPSE